MRRRVTLSYASADHKDSTETKEDRGTDTTSGRKDGTLIPHQNLILANFKMLPYNMK